MRRFIFVSLFVIIVFQLSVLGFRVYKYENIIQHGKTFYFSPVPVDPRDLFQGKYVRLAFKTQKIQTHKNFKDLKWGDFIYVEIEKIGNETRVKDVFKSKPNSGDFLKVKYILTNQKNYIFFNFLFNKFYMNEHKAKKAEHLYNKLAKEDKMLAKVKVLDGTGVIENIYVNSIPINQFFKQ